MRKKNLTSLITCILFFSCSFADNLPAPFKILPLPQHIQLSSKPGFLFSSLQQVSIKDKANLPVLGTILNQLPITANAAKGAVQLVIDKNINLLPSDEGYVLTITADNIKIVAKTKAGLFYGCQTLEQLMEDARDYKKLIPACTITDYPVLSYRAVHFDVKHHLDHMNYYYQSIDRLARYKINAVIFELEDKLRYESQPLVGAPQAMSIDELAALTNYARERNIEITPLVQGLGHATFILKHDEYKNLRELPWNHWAFCPLDEGTYKVLFDLYSDAIKATPGSKYLHIGGDEIGNIGLCPRCKPTADKEGVISINLYWLKKVCAFAKEHNRIPIFWDDMPLQHAGLYTSTWNDDVTAAQAAEAWKNGIGVLDSLQTDFPKNCVYMRWNYSMAKQPGNSMALDWYRKNGLHAMIATATNTEGGFLFQQDDRDKGNASTGISCIQSFIELAAEKNIPGMLCTAWDDKSPHMENYWRGFIAAAEYSWHPQGRTLAAYDDAWLQREFGLTSVDYKKLFDRLRMGTEFWYEALFKKGSLFDDDNNLQSLKQVEHWLKPMEGRENMVVDYTAKLIELPDLKSPGSWSEKYKDKIAQAKALLQDTALLSARLNALENSSKRNRYYWRLSKAMYNFQITTPALLMALQQADVADKTKQQAATQQVQNALENFHLAWSALKEVYSETRFIAYPSNYLPDRYFHLASQAEDLSWMIQAQRLYEGMIQKWMQ